MNILLNGYNFIKILHYLNLIDINECERNLDNCHENASCINTIGWFYCDCKDGFNGNGTYCYGR